MKDFEEWVNKNQKLALAIFIPILLLSIGGIIWWAVGSNGNSSQQVTAPPGGTTAAPGTASAGQSPPGAGKSGGPPGPPQMASAGGPGMMSGPPGGGGAPSGGGSSDADAIQKGKEPAGRVDPMAPYWGKYIPPRIVVTNSGYPTGPDNKPIFTPPTPSSFIASRFWDYYNAQGMPSEISTPQMSGNGKPHGTINPEAPTRMAGILYGPDKVLAVVERGSTDPSVPPASYVVQPGDSIGDGDRVVSISPDAVTVRHGTNANLEVITMRSGSLKGLPPASAASASYGAGMPGGYPGMGGYPGYPGMSSPGYPGYPGMSSPGYPGYAGGGPPGFGPPGFGAPGMAPPPI